jgi:subtilisin family serine protease
METDQKLEPLLRQAFDATEEELDRLPELSVGMTREASSAPLWEVIIRFSGDPDTFRESFPELNFTALSGGYGIVTATKEEIFSLSASPLVTYIEKPKRFFFEVYQGRRISCISSLQNLNPTAFTGKGVLVGVIDSGIDYAHPDFCNADGTTRIAALWDQTIAPDLGKGWSSPDGYKIGTLFSAGQINEALSAKTAAARSTLCPSVDSSGHGTHVAGIAAGNGRSSDGVYRGVAYESSLLVVKLAPAASSGFPSTTQLMQAIDFCVRESIRRFLPLALNISFGNTYGSHSGTSLLETFIDHVSEQGRCSIVVGSGNEGAAGGHTGGLLSESGAGVSARAEDFAAAQPNARALPGETSAGILARSRKVEFTVSDYTPSLSIQLWKNYGDEILLQISGPGAGMQVYVSAASGSQRYLMKNTSLLVYYGEPSPYSIYQEIYLDFLPTGSYLDAGVWSITLLPQKIQSGSWEMWLPSASVRSEATQFLNPSPDITLTIPSTCSRAITVGAYDGATDALAAFSGRGYTWNTRQVKPDLVAPGVDILSCAPGGGYALRTGTSMATPFVTGSAACLMQWGILEGNDRFLYGEKLKAYLRKGARTLPAFQKYPNPETGWGALCLNDSLP